MSDLYVVFFLVVSAVVVVRFLVSAVAASDFAKLAKSRGHPETAVFMRALATLRASIAIDKAFWVALIILPTVVPGWNATPWIRPVTVILWALETTLPAVADWYLWRRLTIRAAQQGPPPQERTP